MATNWDELERFKKEIAAQLLLEQRKYVDFTFDELVEVFYFIHQVEKYIGGVTPDQNGNRICWWKWRVGITDNLDNRKKNYSAPEYNNMEHWNDWDCKTDKVSRNVERFFKRFKKTKGDEGGGNNPHFLYCFYLGPDTKA